MKAECLPLEENTKAWLGFGIAALVSIMFVSAVYLSQSMSALQTRKAIGIIQNPILNSLIWVIISSSAGYLASMSVMKKPVFWASCVFSIIGLPIMLGVFLGIALPRNQIIAILLAAFLLLFFHQLVKIWFCGFWFKVDRKVLRVLSPIEVIEGAWWKRLCKIEGNEVYLPRPELLFSKLFKRRVAKE